MTVTLFAKKPVPFSPLSLFSAGEQGAWYDPSDLTSMYQDAAGTTPVTALEQPVGLIFDKRNPSITSTYFNGVTANITTPDSAALQFSSLIGTIECWVYLPSAVTNNFTGIIDKWVGGPSRGYMLDWGSATASNLGKVRFSVSSATPVVSLSTLAVGQWHHIAGVLDGTNATLYINGVSQGSVSIVGLDASSSGQAFAIGGDGASTLTTTAQHISNVRVVKGTAVYTGNFTPPTAPLTAISGTSLLTCGTSWVSNPALTNNGAVASGFNPFGQSSNHASQSTLAARPVLSARYNLLTYTEQFDNAAWTKQFANITQNSTSAPDGAPTADLMYPVSTGSSRGLYQVPTIRPTATSTMVIYAKAAGLRWLGFIAPTTGTSGCAWFDLQNGAVGTVISNYTATITSVGGDWYRCTVNAPSAAVFTQIFISDADNSLNVTANGTSGIYIWGADLRVANDGVGIPSYQRVAAATDYDSVGFPTYLRFDGVDDCLFTSAINFTATDKMSVFAGVRKLSDATVQQLIELSATAAGTTNYGAFSMPITGAGEWTGSARGNGSPTDMAVATATGFAAPITTVNTLVDDLSLATGDAKLRVNAILRATSTQNTGGGNFGNYPLYIGRRGNTELQFNGRLYSLIIRGAQSTDTQISNTETWVNSKTKAYG